MKKLVLAFVAAAALVTIGLKAQTPSTRNFTGQGVNLSSEETNNLRDAMSAPAVVAVPTSGTAAGLPNQIAVSSTYLYISIGTNSWRRVAISTGTF